MPLQPLDTTLAFKAITLAPGMSGTDKQVAGFIIDSFNRKTGQCDPGLDRIARLLKISRRAVIRGVKKLEAIHFVRKVRHGGKSQRNSYAPNWALFRELDKKWNTIFYAKRGHPDVTNVSPFECQSRHLAGDKDVTQTFLTNHSKKPSLIGPVSEAIKESNKPIARKAHSGQTTLQIGQPFPSASGNRSIDAARAAAERRWCTALHDRYVATPKIYGEIINAIDPTMQGEATEAEIKRHGAGLAYILNELKVLQCPQHSRGGRGV